MKTLFFVLALLSLPMPVSAAVSGEWVGQGEWTFNGQGADCPAMRIVYRETESALERTGGRFDCGSVVLYSDALAWEKRGEELYLNGAKAGEIGAAGFTAVEPFNDEGTMVHTKLVREGNHADYEERWVGSDGREIYLIRGRLFRSAN